MKKNFVFFHLLLPFIPYCLNKNYTPFGAVSQIQVFDNFLKTKTNQRGSRGRGAGREIRSPERRCLHFLKLKRNNFWISCFSSHVNRAWCRQEYVNAGQTFSFGPEKQKRDRMSLANKKKNLEKLARGQLRARRLRKRLLI